ncbi:pirin-related protein [Serinicoccus hydrothermalis]|uniref:Pirin-related protein n=1 Tax=Serinicoccus hydrothermalis TaxID=1758689 RepID=A0A1B1NEV0_9MICO|nr:pirin family protein [Serinicoccus hydrothermalis]ANS79960.1 pirin-related protein [Serinicoccus hydrothermalis]
MSSLETRPDEVTCGEQAEADGTVTVLGPREVPLGGPRAMTVRRTLPTRQRTMIGAWCFVDHYGPDDVTRTGGMVVPPHPHTALQTVSWLFSGLIEHRDSTGVRALVRPGELNLMTAGHGVSHSEVSVGGTDGVAPVLHGAQLWVALPTGRTEVEPSFEHFVPEPLEHGGARVSVFLGDLGVGERRSASPVTTHTPLLGAEVVLQPGSRVRLGVDAGHEHGVLVDEGEVEVAGQAVRRAELAYLAPGREELELVAGGEGVRVLLLGGPPFGEQIVMWWNFIGRSHEEVVAAREQWQTELGHRADGRFGAVDYPDGPSLPAPALPQVRLRPRG